MLGHQCLILEKNVNFILVVFLKRWYASPINCRAQPWLDGIPRVWSVHLQIRFPLQSAAARLSCCCVSLSIPLSLLMLLSWGLTCIFEPACVDMGITISNFTKLKLSCNGGSLGPLESDIPVMLLDSLLKRFASLKMSMKDYIWHTSDIHRTYKWHTTYSMKDYISASINPQFLPGPLTQLARSYYHNRESYELLISCQGAYAKHRKKHRIFKSYSYLLRSKERYRYYNLLKMIYFFNFPLVILLWHYTLRYG